MRIKILILLPLIITIYLITKLNSTTLTYKGNALPQMGAFFSPFTGFWQNAEPAKKMSSLHNIKVNMAHELSGEAHVFMDSNFIPHIVADNDKDAYFIQGYLHAKNRLWQMDFITRVAGGRLSEIVGRKALTSDIFFRRIGLHYAAAKMLQVVAKNKDLQESIDAYCKGANFYINSLQEKDYPVEFKLLKYKPELWTPMHVLLMLEYIAYDLGGWDLNLLDQNTKNVLGYDDFNLLFNTNDYKDPYPIIPANTQFQSPSVQVHLPKNVEKNYYYNNNKVVVSVDSALLPLENYGSNNWAVSGKKTLSGKPILCNDPHLAATLPSCFYENQITTPQQNVYGASLPGVPFVVIGFNDSMAFGMTNGTRMQKLHYALKIKDSKTLVYEYKGKWVNPESIITEVIAVRGGAYDTQRIAVTKFGLLTYTPQYNETGDCKNEYVTTQWENYENNESAFTFWLLDHGKNYADYQNALNYFSAPAQNFIYADATGNIAIKEQGRFPALWKDQATFVLPGIAPDYEMQGYIPNSENPTSLNPEQQYLVSTNQIVADSKYPYEQGYWGFYAYTYPKYRNEVINEILDTSSKITVQDMMRLQNNVFNKASKDLLPLLISKIEEHQLTPKEEAYLQVLKDWNGYDSTTSIGASTFAFLFEKLINVFYDPIRSASPVTIITPNMRMFSYVLTNDRAFKALQRHNTTIQNATASDLVLKSFQEILPTLDSLSKIKKLAWGAYRTQLLPHILQIPAFGTHVCFNGSVYTVNNIKAFDDNRAIASIPAYRMIVEFTNPITAYTIMPGGQSGNMGSYFYNNEVSRFQNGHYNRVVFLTKNGNDLNNALLPYQYTFSSQ
ncbi:MAG: penicillin acylase family protein [Phycisphaerales bacterium]|nr:penicillin acylase family protein [Phycisphaerales bacterium]